ncbi:TRAP-type C4-dicarboxylate transport system substrate-binding protein [Psychrobacter luti]|uniref:TRAP-type C4-dicarboxylate transport system substrate-binding protein n=1 Tax=Psychrobacter luti TaxID=198481 RepID=A0A839T8S7_9GAMM|nr:TRAP transporter substrate-binding protein [Psychrobacter luti]MBB3105529.1 TRAP-type C4-dicarboxylate transport system substrate-binding protein [Psychrobacter luti]
MKIKTPLGIALASLLTLSGCSNNEQSVSESIDSDKVTTLRFSHFMTANDNINTEGFEPWARKIEEDSKGRLKVEIYPSATLSKPGATYEAAAKGTVDIGMQVQGYTAGRFPLTQVVELPGISNTAEQQTCILYELYNNGAINSEYEDTHLLSLMGSGQGALHTADKPIRTPADMKGLRIRQPSVVASHVIDTIGAAPVGMPASDTYTSLQRGVIDGLAFTWQPIQAFRLDELLNHHTNIPFYNSTFVVTMNKDKYNSLPDDLKKVIDDNSGLELSKRIARVFDESNEAAMAAARAKGDTMIDIPDPLNDPNWKGPLLEGTQRYLDELAALGLDGDAVYDQAKAASVACKV